MPDDTPIPPPTREELEDERKICEAASSAPWESVKSRRRYAFTPPSDDECDASRAVISASPSPSAAPLIPVGLLHWTDADFVAHARTALPLRNQQCLALLDEVKRLRELLKGRDTKWRELSNLNFSLSDGCAPDPSASARMQILRDELKPLTDAEIDAVKGEGG